MASRSPRIFRYEVDEVWGSMKGRIKIGDVILDKWKADRCWQIMDSKKAEIVGGWGAKLLGEADPELTAKVHADWDAKRT
jgi:hypothetical protein